MIYTFPWKVENRKCRHLETIKRLANFTHPCHPWRLNMIPVFIHMENCHSSREMIFPWTQHMMRGSREDKQKGNKRKNWTLNYIKLTQLNKRWDLTATLHYTGGCFHFITRVNSDQKVTEYRHFNQGSFTKARARTHTFTYTFSCPVHWTLCVESFMKESLEDIQRSLARFKGMEFYKSL